MDGRVSRLTVPPPTGPGDPPLPPPINRYSNALVDCKEENYVHFGICYLRIIELGDMGKEVTYIHTGRMKVLLIGI